MQKKIPIIVGLGKTGLSCVRYFVKQNLPIAAVDSRTEPPGLAEFKKQFSQVPLYLGKLDEKVLLQASELIVSPGLSLEELIIKKANQQAIPIIGDIELFARRVTAPIIAITGTNGKGTVTSLVGEMLRSAGHDVRVGGNIGVPALDLITTTEPEFYVLELSSFQLETTYSLQPAVASILNISIDHLDRHHTMAAYVAAKQGIYQQAKIAVCNRDDRNTYPHNVTTQPLFTFGITAPRVGEFGLQQIAGQHWLVFGDKQLIAVDELLIKGQHNWANALAALAIGHALKLPLPAMLQSLRTFKGLPHRCECVLEHQNIGWYNDSKGANVGATLAAIQSLGSAIKGKLILIAGGVDKGADFLILQTPIENYVRSVILIGESAPLIKKALSPTTRSMHAASMQDAVQLAQQEAQAGDCVLLSPACASFDMFRNAEDRGEVFKAVVKQICK